jgi:hypothetical protein
MSLAVHDVYRGNLATSGKLKLRAKALLAEGTGEATFQACVLLHEAARIQRLALEALPVCPPETRLASLIEETWCYVEGRDPPLAAEAWSEVLPAREEVEARAADGMLSRVIPLYAALQREFSLAVHASPEVLALREAGRLDHLPPDSLARARKELGRLLERFPGATSFWWMAYRLAESAGDRGGAWDALRRARELAPTNPRFLAMSVLVAAWALSPVEADKYLAAIRPTIANRAEPEVCLMYGLAELRLAEHARASERPERWSRARDAADAGVARARTEGLRRNLKATQLIARELLAGRKPTMDILYRAGLSEVAATAKTNANVTKLLFERELRAA